MSGIGERSPFPSRSRRRSGGVVGHHHHHHNHPDHDASFASPFFGNAFLGSTSRISPRDSYVSPIASGRSSTRRRFLFDEDRSRRLSQNTTNNKSTTIPSTPKATPHNNSSSNNSHHTHQNYNNNKKNNNDGIPVAQLRELSKSCLDTQTNPELAVFYMGMVYTKSVAPTGGNGSSSSLTTTSAAASVDDAFLYAKALLANQEYRRAVYILEKSGLLLGGGGATGPSPLPQEDHHHHASSSSRYAKLRLEATLLAAQALTKASGQVFSQEAQRMLEDASRPLVLLVDNNNGNSTTASSSTSTQYYHQSTTTVLDDEDDLGWELLARSMMVDQTSNNNNGSTTTTSSTEVNVVARLCYWRGRLYDACSYPSRAKLFWKRALQLDPKCQAAWERLWTRHLLTAQEAHELFSNKHSNKRLLERLQREGMEWLGHFYVAQIPPLTTDDDENDNNNKDEEQENAPSSFAVNADVLVESVGGVGSTSATAAIGSTPMEGGEQLQQQQEDINDNYAHLNPSDASMDKLVLHYKLDSSPELLALAANRAYRRYDVQAALDYCQELALVDPLCQSAALVHVASLVALGHKRGLFGLAHEWVQGASAAASAPTSSSATSSAIAWFAVGAYYYACGKYHRAQHHFCRATRLDPQCSEAWLGFGCSFAACDESDQALAAFRAAQRLAPAEPTSLLYMGMEYVRTNHLVLAKHALKSVLSTDPQNPLGYHELGVAAYQAKQYEQSMEWLMKAIKAIYVLEYPSEQQQQSPYSSSSLSTQEMIQRIGNEFWEPTIFNLGHAYRKLGKMNHAMACYERSLVLVSSNTSALSAMGFCQHLLGNVDEAIDHYHQALGQAPDDPFCGDMVYRAMNEAMGSGAGGASDAGVLDFLPLSSRAAATATPVVHTPRSASLLQNDDPQQSMMMMDDSAEEMSMT